MTGAYEPDPASGKDRSRLGLFSLRKGLQGLCIKQLKAAGWGSIALWQGPGLRQEGVILSSAED